MIILKNVCKLYRNGETNFFALKDINLEIKSGEFVSILGTSGSGKSTLLHLIGGLDTVTYGTIEVDGKNIAEMNEKESAKFRNKTIGFIFQFFNLLPHTSALNNVMLPLVYSDKKSNRKQRAKTALKLMGLESKLKNYPSTLSGGEQQRVAIARALINSPKIILADEPTGNLDTETGLHIFGILQKLNLSGKTILMVTHDKLLAEKTSRIVKIQDGKILA